MDRRIIILSSTVLVMIIVMVIIYYAFQPSAAPEESPVFVPTTPPTPTVETTPSESTPITPTSGSLGTPAAATPTTAPTPAPAPAPATEPAPSTTLSAEVETRPVNSNAVRLYLDANKAGQFIDLSYGKQDLTSPFKNAVSSLDLGSDVNVALFNKVGCDPTYWSVLQTSSVDKLDDKYNNNAACAIVLPKGIDNNMTIECNGNKYKIDGYVKRKYPSDAVYASWGSPTPTVTDCNVVWKVPDGSDMTPNPDYVPPLASGNIRLYSADKYTGKYVDLPFGMSDVPSPLTNAALSVQISSDTDAILFDKQGCTAVNEPLHVIDNIPSLSDKYRNDIACVIVLPKGVYNGDIVTCDGVKKYKIVNGRKSLFPTEDIYKSWMISGTPKKLTCDQINKIPAGLDMTTNPLYVVAGTARLFPNKDYLGTFGDYQAGMTDLPDGLKNNTSSVIVGGNTQAALFDKQGCLLGSWNMPISGQIPSIADVKAGYNNDAACIVVLPASIKEGDVVSNGTDKWLIENYHKRKFSSYAYDSWKTKYPTVVAASDADISKVPDGDSMSVNPAYDPPLAADKFARLYAGENYAGGFVDLGWGLFSLTNMNTNLGNPIANKVTSVKVAPGAQAVLYDKSDCSPSNWFEPVLQNLASLVGSGHNDDVACVIVVPSSIVEGSVMFDGANIYKIENYHKRLYSSDVYTSWNKPAIKATVTSAVMAVVPDGPAMEPNPDYEPPMAQGTVRLFPDQNYKGKYINYTSGMFSLPDSLKNDVSSYRVKEIDAALFNKADCSTAYWNLPLTADAASMSDPYNNNAACLIVLPFGLKEGDLLTNGTSYWTIEKYHKRKYSDYAYASWKSSLPAPKTVTDSILATIPDGDNMSVNPKYDPPLAADKFARIYAGENYVGGFVDLGWGLYSLTNMNTNLGEPIANKVTSVKVAPGAQAVLYDKSDCTPSSWFEPVLQNLASLVGSGHNDDVACVIVVPSSIIEGAVMSDGTNVYLIENYHKRLYSPSVYITWYKPAVKATVTSAVLATVPDGPPMEANPDYEPPMTSGTVRLFPDPSYKGKYIDYTPGMTSLPDSLKNIVSSYRVKDIDAALFNKVDCSTAYWNLPLTADADTMPDPYNNNAACLVVLPSGVKEGDVLTDGSTYWSVEKYHKRKYSAYAYTSWKDSLPAPKTVTTDVLAKIPDGDDMAVNPKYDPPLPSGKYARVYRDASYSGGFVDLGYGMTNLTTLTTNNGLPIANQVTSVKVATNFKAILFNKSDCSPSYWYTPFVSSVATLVGSGHDNDAACVIVIPNQVDENKVYTDNTRIFYIDSGYRKRAYTPDAYVSWYSPAKSFVAAWVLNLLPDGAAMPVNPNYVAPPGSAYARLHANHVDSAGHYIPPYVDTTYGMTVLSTKTPNLANDVSAVQVGSNVDVVLFDKDDCTIGGWPSPLLVTANTPSLQTISSAYNNDAACVITLPKGLRNGATIRCPSNGYVYKIENYRKRYYPTTIIYQSWGSPAYTDVDCAVINALPSGPNMAMNPLWVPPGAVRLYTNDSYAGGYVDLTPKSTPINLNTVMSTDGSYIGNKVSSLKTASGMQAGLYNKSDCDPAYWKLSLSGNIPALSTYGSGYNDNAACVIVLPQGYSEGNVIHEPSGAISKIINHRRRHYPNWDIYVSWGAPAYKEISSANAALIPSGGTLEYNPAAANTTTTNLGSVTSPAEFWTSANYSGKVLKLGRGKFVLSQFTPNVANAIVSINNPQGLRIQVWDKDDFTGNTLILTSSISTLEGTGLKNDIASVMISK